MRFARLLVSSSLLVGCAVDANTNTDPNGEDASAALDIPSPTFHRDGNHARVCDDGVDGTAACHARVIVDGEGHADATNGPSGFHPADLINAYGIPAGGNLTTIAIVDAYGYPSAESDLGVYRAQFGLAACTTANGCFRKVDQRGGTAYPQLNVGWSQETALDLDMVSAICPSCKILLVQADSASFANLAAAEDTAAGLGALVISNSYGGGENGSSAYESHYNHLGVAITASSGDSGYGVEFPASSPHVTAVGGTHLVKDTSARGWTETVWSGAGSGCSTTYAKPAWQTDSGCAMRTVADVSAVADPNTGVAVYGLVRKGRPGWMVFGGTSVAAPLIAGVYGASGGGATNTLYSNTASLNDVVSGSNGSCGGSYLCTAGAGYDGPTGLGTPNGLAAF
jgi:subtilase family serine protease